MPLSAIFCTSPTFFCAACRALYACSASSTVIPPATIFLCAAILRNIPEPSPSGEGAAAAADEGRASRCCTCSVSPPAISAVSCCTCRINGCVNACSCRRASCSASAARAISAACLCISSSPLRFLASSAAAGEVSPAGDEGSSPSKPSPSGEGAATAADEGKPSAACPFSEIVS